MGDYIGPGQSWLTGGDGSSTTAGAGDVSGTTGVPSDFASQVLTALARKGIDVTQLDSGQIESLLESVWDDPYLQDQYRLGNDPTQFNLPADVTVNLRADIERQLFSATGSTSPDLLGMGLNLMVGQGMSLSPSQSKALATGSPSGGGSGYLADLARQAGFPESEIATAVAVAMAESGGRSDAVGDQSIGGSIGLWQIYTRAHPDLVQKYDLTDPLQNARAAYEVWKGWGGSWAPWTTYNTGAYLQYMGAGSGPYVRKGPSGTDLKSLYPVAAEKFRAVYGRDPTTQELMSLAGLDTAQINEALRNSPSHLPGISRGEYDDVGGELNRQMVARFGHQGTDGMIADVIRSGHTSPSDIAFYLDKVGIEGKGMNKDTYKGLVALNRSSMDALFSEPGFDPRIAYRQHQRMTQAQINEAEIQRFAEQAKVSDAAHARFAQATQRAATASTMSPHPTSQPGPAPSQPGLPQTQTQATAGTRRPGEPF